jgi:hypothetical protein
LSTTERGGFVHNHLIRRLAAFFLSRGLRAEIEKKFTLNAAVVAVDLAVTPPHGGPEAFEVQIAGNPEDAIAKCVQLGAAKVVVVVQDNAQRAKIAARIAKCAYPCPVKVATPCDLGLESLPQFDGNGRLCG